MTRAPRRVPARSRSPATWTASSRVGQTTRACGLPGLASDSNPSSVGVTMRWRIGTPNPRVLPVPVLAWPMMSWPPRATGRVIAWMGNGVTMLIAVSAATMSGWTSKSAKVGSGVSTVGWLDWSGSAASGAPASREVSVMKFSRSSRASRGLRVVAAVLRADRRSVVAPRGRAESLSGFSIRADRAPKVCVSLPAQGVGARSAITRTVVYRIVKAPPAASTASPMPSTTAAAMSGGICPKKPLVGSWSTQSARV